MGDKKVYTRYNRETDEFEYELVPDEKAAALGVYLFTIIVGFSALVGMQYATGISASPWLLVIHLLALLLCTRRRYKALFYNIQQDTHHDNSRFAN